MRANLLLTALIATTALTGCGRTAATQPGVPSVTGTSQRIGLPARYQPGEVIPGMDGTPSLRGVNWPRLSHTAKGIEGDPVNLVVTGSERQVRHIFGAMGWLEADPNTPITAARTIKAALTNGEYPTSPMSELLLYNRKQDIAFQKNPIGVRARDHLRIWRTPLVDHLGRPCWAIAATKDVAIKWGPGEKLPTHQISPNIDSERQLVVNDVAKSGQVAMRYQLQSLPENHKGVNGGGDEYYTDGKVEVLELRFMK